MGKNKLKKFSEMESIPFVLQYPWAALQREPFPHRGRWDTFFGNSNPITLELGCGKGEYTVELARRYPDRNFIGIDIKGARIWTGAKAALAEGLTNVAFLRTDIDLLPSFFAPGEVAEMWITFPDPQMQKPRKRLTGTRMLSLYSQVMKPDGTVNLKTDSPFLFAYTSQLAEINGFGILRRSADVYAEADSLPPEVSGVRTHYESQWLDRGLTIKYIAFIIGNKSPMTEVPEDELPEKDTYRSYSRGYIQMPQLIGNE